jgi:short-subunit dehydrogenase
MATTLVQNGANVIIASRKEKALKQVADELNALGKGRCDYVIFIIELTLLRTDSVLPRSLPTSQGRRDVTIWSQRSKHASTSFTSSSSMWPLFLS